MAATTKARDDAAAGSSSPIEIRDAQARFSFGGLLSLVGAAVMAVGGIVWATAGANMWGVVDGDIETATFLTDAASSSSTLTAAHIIWLTGAFVIALGGILLSGPGTTDAAMAGRATFGIGAALAIPSFVIMIAVTRLADRGADGAELAEALAFVGVRLDDLATVAIIGLGPMLIALANRATWVPRWLAVWAMICGAVGLISLISIPFGQADGIGFIVVPVGLIWMMCAGVISLRNPVP